MRQNLAGARENTPTDKILLQIRDALLALQAPGQPLSPGDGTYLYVGPKMRFAKLSNGGKLEVLNSSGTWIEQARWTEA